MNLEQNIDLKDLKKQKNEMRKIFKKAIKQYDLDKIQQGLSFIEKYDEIVKSYKYEKYYNMLTPQIKEAIRVRDELAVMKEFDTRVYDIFEEKLMERMKSHIDKYNNKMLFKIKKDLTSTKKQIDKKNKNRVKHPSKK